MPTLDIALPLWSVVHGVASLQIDGDFESVVPGTDIGHLVEMTTRRYLQGLINHSER